MAFTWSTAATARRAGFPPPPVPPEPRKADAGGLLELAVCELHSTALLAATLASFANALPGRERVMKPSEVLPYQPHDLGRLAHIVALIEEERLGGAGLAATSEFLMAVAEAGPALDSYLVEAARIGAARASVVHARPLAAAWRLVCRSAALMLAEVDELLGEGLPEIYRDNAGVLKSLLAGAASGLRPCIDEAGQVFLPPLPQRRRWPRKTLLQSCRVRAGNREFRAFVRDVSAGGLGLEMMPQVGPGDVLQVTLECGRVLRGAVQWAAGGAAGVSFEALLLPADPLLAG